jgi:hypothetical protein
MLLLDAGNITTKSASTAVRDGTSTLNPFINFLPIANSLMPPAYHGLLAIAFHQLIDAYRRHDSWREKELECNKCRKREISFPALTPHLY